MTAESGAEQPTPSAKDGVVPNHSQIQSTPAPVHSDHAPPAKGRSKVVIGAAVLLVLLLIAAIWIFKTLGTVSTDDGYVNGHVTFVAPRVAGQVARVLVDDNNRVHRGDLLVQIDKEPLQIQVDIAQTALAAAQSDLTFAQAQTRGLEGQTRSMRFALEHSIEDVDNQIALLRSKVAIVNSQEATLAKAQADYTRALPLVDSGAVTREELDRRKESLAIAQSQVEEALQGVYQIRVGLGLPPKPETGDDLAQVPPNLNQNFSSVRQAQASLIQSAALLGVTQGFNQTPADMVTEFYKRDPQGNIDRIYEKLLKEAPAVKQAQAKLAQAEANLDQAKLNLRYCDVISDIDGVVTRRDVNPGNNVVVGQSLMAVRSLTDIWIDANFKETQLGSLRIGQRADLDVDMYGSRHHFAGRISGFTMGTGSTLALLPAENATGNFVKVVQRLPVRIDLVDYDPDKVPLFIGLSVSPTVYTNEEATGPNAGSFLQPYQPATAPPATQEMPVETGPTTQAMTQPTTTQTTNQTTTQPAGQP
jgi:membrane fusion protein, multidrug efflux system